MRHLFLGPSRSLFASYDGADLALTVASAIHRGFLAEGEVGAEFLELLARHLAFFRERGADAPADAT